MNMNNYCTYISDVTQHSLIQPKLIDINFASTLILNTQQPQMLNIIGSHELIPNITDYRSSMDAMQPVLQKANYNLTEMINLLNK